MLGRRAPEGHGQGAPRAGDRHQGLLFGKRRSGIGRDYHHYSIIVDREDEPFDWSEIAEDEDEIGPRTDLPADPEPPKPSIDDEPPPFD